MLLVLGLPALISKLHTSEFEARKSLNFMLLATAIFIAAAFLGPITWVHGLIFLGVLGVFLGDAFRESRRPGQVTEEAVEGADARMPGWKVGGYLLAGLIGLPVGADILVEGAVDVARDFGVREAVIGLTLVAIGTSLPELATTVAAAFRRTADVAIGNVIGSNMFNLLAITGVASLVGPLPVDHGILRFDIWVMALSSALLVPFVFFRVDIGKRVGSLLVALYAAYILAILV